MHVKTGELFDRGEKQTEFPSLNIFANSLHSILNLYLNCIHELPDPAALKKKNPYTRHEKLESEQNQGDPPTMSLEDRKEDRRFQRQRRPTYRTTHSALTDADDTLCMPSKLFIQMNCIVNLEKKLPTVVF